VDATLADTQYGKVLAAVVARLQAIAVSRGYHVTVKPESVVSDPANPFNVPDADCPWFLVEPNTGGRRDWHPAYEVEDVFPLLITTRAIASGADPFRKMALAFNLAGDIERALTRDATTQLTDVTLGGNAIDVRVQALEPPPIPGFGEDQNVFVLTRVDVHYVRQYGTP
jgi:hypothetical protein